MREDELWTDAELRVALDAYLNQMATVEGGAQHYPTSFHSDLSKGALADRSPGSVGRRMSNLSWILHSSGLPYFRRYSPSLTQAGTGVRNRVLRLYAERMAGAGVSPAASEGDLATVIAPMMVAPPEGATNPASTQATVTRHTRSLAVMAWVLKQANGTCDACGRPAPFRRSNGSPYLEVHHLHRLADGGPDVVENAVAVCPNCHRQFHFGADLAVLTAAVSTKIESRRIVSSAPAP